MDSDFVLHERLAADCIDLGETDLCQILLMNDQRYPWIILVPKRPNIREIHDLSTDDQLRLFQDITSFSQSMQASTGALKMNVAALGNMVPQLHIHIIARFDNDEAWPGPVWGVGNALPYAEGIRPTFIDKLPSHP